MTTQYLRKANRAGLRAVIWLQAFIAAVAFTYGNTLDDETRHLAVLTAIPAVISFIALIVQIREAVRCYEIHFTRFIP